MPGENSLTVDLSQKDDVLKVLPYLPLLSSEALPWAGIHVQYHIQPAWETPEQCHAKHMVLVHERIIDTERVLDGRRQREQPCDRKTIVIPANVSHRASWDREGEFTAILLEPSHLARTAYDSVNADCIELIPQFGKPDPLIYGIGFALKQQLEADQSGARLYVAALTTALSAHLLQHYCIRKQRLREYQDGLPKYKLQQAIAYIHDHFDRDLSLEGIAQEVGMSQYYFCRLFKQSTGVTPYQYVQQCRIERAKQLLSKSQLSIVEIARTVGFTNQNQFAAFFRKHTNLTPTAYRQQQ